MHSRNIRGHDAIASSMKVYRLAHNKEAFLIDPRMGPGVQACTWWQAWITERDI